MASRYLMQIVERNQHVLDGQPLTPVQFEPGLSAEIDFVDTCVTNILAKGVAYKSAKHIEADIRAGIEEAITKLKSLIRHHP